MPQWTDLNQVEAAWHAARLSDGRIEVQPALIPAGDVLGFVGTLPQPLVMQNAAVTRPDATRLEIDGMAYGTWTVPALANGRPA